MPEPVLINIQACVRVYVWVLSPHQVVSSFSRVAETFQFAKRSPRAVSCVGYMFAFRHLHCVNSVLKLALSDLDM